MARCSVADLSRSGAPALECEAAVRAPALRHALRQLPAPGRPAPDVRLAVRQRRTRRVRRCGFRADGRGRARAGARARDRVVRGGAAATRAGGRFFACRDRGVFRRSRVAATDPWTSAPPPMAAAAAQGLPHVVRASLRPSRASVASCGGGLMPEWPDLALAKRTGKRVVVVFDEFQAAGRLGPRVFDVMRTRFQAQRGVSYAFLGSEQGILEELFSEKGHAFYRFAVPLDLTDAGGHRFGIDPDDWLDYLKAKFAAKKLGIDDASVDRLLDATGGHPQDTMQVCAALYYLMRDSGSRSVTPDLLEVAYEQAMRELERPFALHWTELGSHKYLQQVAKRIAHRAVLYAAEGDGA